MMNHLYQLGRVVFLLTLLGLFSGMTEVWAQNRQVTGKIIESSGQAIPGASVLVKGTTSGANTNTNGEFTVTLTSTDAVLLITAVGYKTQEIVVGNQTRIDVTLQEEAASLNEVVVTGYTTDSRRETTGAVSTVKTKDLTVTPSGNVEQQLQGRVAGVTVITNGQPGTTSQVRVRGFGAFGGNEPLYIVDGVPTSSTEFLNPDDIESTTVLKDAASASIYGARAASGVIVYTTKKGQRQARKLTVTYDGLFGLTDPGKGQQMMNPTDFANWTWNAYRNNGWKVGDDEWTHPQFGNGANPVIPDYLMVGKNYGVVGNINLDAERAKYNVNFDAGDIYQVVATNRQGTDWYKAITRTAPLMRHSLGFSGGTESSRYYVGLGIQTQAGILKYNDFKRYSIRANTEFDVLKNLRIGQNFQATYRQVLGQSGGNGGAGVSADENDILSAFRMPSIIPIYDVFGGYAGTAAKGFNNPRNPVASRDGQKDNRGFGASAFGNAYLEFDPIQNLTLRSSIGGSYTGYSNWGYNRRQYENSENNSAFSYNETYGFNFAWTFTNTANFKKDFGLHNVDVLVGQEALNTGAGRENRTSGQSPFSIDKNYVTITNVSSRVANSDLYRGATFYSLFGRLKYSFNEGKYVVTGLVRRDGSSKFAAANRFGVFPAFSAAWRISEEPFLKNVGFLQDLKIRGGWGIMGNSNNVNPTNQYSLYATTLGQSAYDLNGTNSSTLEGYYRSQIGNPFAKWESSVTSNIGFDATLFDGKLDVILDLWRKNTKDLLFQVPVTAEVGTSAQLPYVNSGQMRNQGIDLQLINRGKISSDLNYEVNVTAGWLDNKIVSLAQGLKYLTSVNPGFRGINPIRNQLGYSISSFYGYKVTNLFRDQAEVDGAPQQDGAGPGRFRYQDLNNDGVINADDRTYLGSPVPKFVGGLNLTLRYKNFDFVTYLYTSLGNKVFNVSKWFTDFYPSFAGAAISERVKESWTPNNLNASIPIFESASNFSTNTQSNSFYVEDGSYLRLQNLSLGYTLPAPTLSKLRMQKLRIYISTNNLFTITKYQGLDPAVGGNADTNFGIDVGNYPVTRSWVAGINLAF
ncbi:TonB-dependent receptor [Siphonobacter sp. BAB-5385]|uniref:SusC/RagA family TonB-linked outer membrane protein n=1 Tax=Siphonobacter sp. BAB-5385 TaxID=1864822 RepID=UPI0020CFE608|nr:TonB-dependent receptor [Siphonobacter sp. BAB-5385]